jgi:predicted TIM-barrel enzyme
MTVTLHPAARLDGMVAARRARAVFVPALAPFVPRLWPLVGLLPILDFNGALLAALAARRPFRAAPPVAAVFVCDPFLRVADLAAALKRAGIAAVVNHPSVQVFEGETAAALAAVGYRAEAEFRVLRQLAEAGLAPIAAAASRSAADAALALGLRRILLHPGLAASADPAGWWSALASHVAIEGGEALAWEDHSKPRRRMRL